MKRTLILLISAFLLLLSGTVLASGPPVIDRHVVGSGGGHVEAGTYALNATLGQAVVGLDSQGAYQLCSGYRCQALYKLFLPLMLRQQL